MSWSTPADLRAQMLKRWERGELLRHLITGEPPFPLRLSLNLPGSADIASRFEEVRAWAAELARMPLIRLEHRDVAHRVQGLNRVIQSAWVGSLEDALTLAGKRREAQRFVSMVERTRTAQPGLIDWLAKRPLNALELADHWERLLDTVAWICAHPRPGIYLRQADIPGVHSKFIEAHRGVLAELLDLVLAPEAIDFRYSGAAQFAPRYGFRQKPVRIRFRSLDPRLRILSTAGLPDLTLDAESFITLDPPVRTVFITENETNFLAFPPVDHALVIFGAGYGWDALAKAQWLHRCDLHYWGDIDTHGFGILDQLRSHFPQVRSFLMDRGTLMTHEPLWGHEPDPLLQDLPRLTGPERALFDDLRDNRIRRNLRLEQELVAFGWLQPALQQAFSAD